MQKYWTLEELKEIPISECTFIYKGLGGAVLPIRAIALSLNRRCVIILYSDTRTAGRMVWSTVAGDEMALKLTRCIKITMHLTVSAFTLQRCLYLVSVLSKR